jgi:hypothetical protein
MIKKTIVIVQLLIVCILGALIVGQLDISPEKAKRINRKDPLWFMAPWRPDGKDGASGSSPTPTPQATSNKVAMEIANRHYILSPGPALSTIVTELENKDLEPTGPVLLPTERSQTQPTASKKGSKAPEPRKAPPPAGPLTIASLSVTPTANGVMLKGLTSAPAKRMELYTFVDPPRMVLELFGQFAPYSQSVSVPPNPIIASVVTEISGDKILIIGDLLTDKAYVAPAARVANRDEFAVELTLRDAGQANTEGKH